MPDDAPLNATGFYRGLRDLMAGMTSTSGEIDEETGLLIGWDEPPYAMVDRSHCSYCRFTIELASEGQRCKSGGACPFSGQLVRYVAPPPNIVMPQE